MILGEGHIQGEGMNIYEDLVNQDLAEGKGYLVVFDERPGLRPEDSHPNPLRQSHMWRHVRELAKAEGYLNVWSEREGLKR